MTVTEWITIISLIISTLSIPTLFGVIWKNLYDKKKENSQKTKEKKKEEFQNNVREVLRQENEPIKQSIFEINEKLDLVSDGTLSSLRNDIKNCFYECVDKGYRTDYDFQNIHDLYDSYTKLGGNSFIKDIMSRFETLPTKDEYERRKNMKSGASNDVIQQIRVQKVRKSEEEGFTGGK